MLRKIKYNSTKFFLLFLVILIITSFSVFGQTRVVVTGEDSDSNSVGRNSEIFKRVISQLQESLGRGGYYVIDEDMLAVKLGFAFNSRRPKAELVETLMVANETNDATVQSRLAVIFAIFPQVKELSFTKKLEVRVRGDIYDLKTFRPLANFEYKPNKAYVIPKSYSQCDTFCIQEILGEKSREVARELGDVLVKKLEISVNKISGSSSTSSSSSQNLTTTYNLNLIRFKTAQAIKFKRALSQMSNIKSLKTLSVETSQRAYALETSVDLGLLEELIFESAMNADVDINNIRIVMSGTEIEVENLN